MDKSELGQLIRTARRQKGWTQEDLANAYGCSQSLVSEIERGQVSINITDLSRLARILGKSVSYFFPEHQPSHPPGWDPATQGTDEEAQREVTEEKLRRISELVRDLPPDLQNRIMDQAIATAEMIRAARAAGPLEPEVKHDEQEHR